MNFLVGIKYHKLFLVPILILLSLLLLNINCHVVKADEALDKQNAIRYADATPHPTRRFFMWQKNGFNINPISDYNITTDGSAHIHVNFVHKLFGGSAQYTYIWHRKVNDEPWDVDNSSTTQDITVKSDQPKIIRYQLELIAGLFFKDPPYYSDVATVHITSKPIKADSLDIEVSNKYLYNIPNNTLTDNTAFAYPKPNPKDATEPVIWTTSDPSKAKIDQNGLITAVPNDGKNAPPNQYNIFYIIGTIINKDGTIAVGQKLMSIGGGIYDQTTRAGEKATFTIQGFDVQSRDNNEPQLKVDWYKDTLDKKNIHLTTPKDNPFSYTTDTLTAKNDGESYYAIVSVPKHKDKRLKTSFGQLTILPALDPQVKLTDDVKNETFTDPANSDFEIHKVTNDDQVTYTYHLNNNGKKDLHNTVLSTHFRLGTEITQVLVDNIPIAEGTNYKVEDHEENRNRLLTIDIGQLNVNQGGDVTVKTKVHDITDKSFFEAKPSFIGVDSNNNSYQSIGDNLTLDYVTNQFITKFKDIQFDSIYPSEENVLKHRSIQTNAPNDVITIDDQRRIKSHVCIFLKQPVILTNAEKKKDLNASLQFIGNQNDIPQPIQNKFPIAHSTVDQPLKSIAWKRDKGLLLHIDKRNPIAGNYSAKLTWIIQDSIC